MDQSFAEKVIAFIEQLDFRGVLPEGIEVMNPFQENEQVFGLSNAFYRKYYDDHRSRRLILGINPGRFGAGVTGIPFTDTKRLKAILGMELEGVNTHEPSSVFVYEVIDAYGGPEAFYSDFFISSICPLGFTRHNERGKAVNFNYYDSKALTEAVGPFIRKTLKQVLDFGILRDRCYCMGTGKNMAYLTRLNQEMDWFQQIIPLEHPRFVMQYRSRQKEEFVKKYLKACRGL